jgi:hypothetical protein
VTPGSGPARDTFRGARGGPLNLIHTNNSPNPVSMRVSGRLTLENIPAGDLSFWLDFMSGPVGQLLLKRRAAHGAK